MATRPVSSDPATAQHYAASVALTAALVAALKKLWPMIDLANLKGSLPAYKGAVVAVTQHYGSASSSLAADYYEGLRVQAGVTEPFRTPLIDPPLPEQVNASVEWATRDLWDSRLVTPPADFSPDDAIKIIQTNVEGATQKAVTDTGRNQLIAAIEQDRQARGFARVTRPGACYFCRMLATRGAVYHSRESAGMVAASTKWPDAKGEINRYHDHCHCQVVPLFGRHYEAPAHTRDDMALWKEVSKGKTGPEAIKAFRRAVEGRA